MKRTAILIVFLALGLIASISTAAQDVPTTPQSGVVLVKLAPLVYPPLPRQAHITGDVKVNLHVRADGTIGSMELISGHPMLAPAAIENAKNSEFECRRCSGETEYTLTYTFGFIEDLTPYNKFEDRRVRAGKCLYLWKCGVVRVNTSNFCTAHVPPQISQGPGYVRILVLPVCIEAVSSAVASE